MIVYQAPMEGITGYIFRNALHDLKDNGIVKFFTPFIVPRPKKGMQDKERRDLLPGNNPGIKLIPQILCNRAGDFLALADEIHEKYGWDEFNLNAGCPSGTVTSHNKGAGMLRDTEELKRFLDSIFSHSSLRISVKTRLGIDDEREFEKLLPLYESFPLCELIVHARVLADQYRGPARYRYFNDVAARCRLPLIYNGDIFTPEDPARMFDGSGAEAGLMLGRGLIADPALGRELNGGEPLSTQEFSSFYENIYTQYCSCFDSDMPLLYHMKELWSYWAGRFPEEPRLLKAIQKSKRRSDYEEVIRRIL
ncbi:MAG: tRNA-dihydrouridine synthase family protein [Lachnospiraceae bacterium]|nr:tRNA-dihydrouridine synthase family protein [Lachnospiraceae bacterium]